jgi:mRNA-degrading endonuclease toxin of MazEF toxin-antitoxin module
MTTAAGVDLPDAGDIVWVDLDPVRGSEQAGARPALVLTSRAFHELSRKAIVCPITSNLDPWPTKVPLPPGLDITGAILVDQVRTLDRRMRGFRHVGRVPDDVLADVRARLAELIGIAAAAR